MTVLRVGRYMRFLVVGSGNAIVDLLVLNILLFFWPSHSSLVLIIYNTIAVVLSITNSYIWNRLWTFKDVSNGSSREKWLFLIQALVNIMVNDAILVWLTTYFVSLKIVSPYIQSNVAKGIAMLVSSSISYFMMRFLVFRTDKLSRSQNYFVSKI